MYLGQNCQSIAQCKQNIESWNIYGHLRRQNSINRSKFRTAATSKIERFVIIVNAFQPLTTITKCSILDVAAVLDTSLIDVPSWLLLSTFLINSFVRNRMFLNLESFLLIPDVYRSLFLPQSLFQNTGTTVKFCGFFFKESALLMLFRTICKSFSVWSHRRFIVHFMTISMVLKKKKRTTL